jgi:hypothetical protein
MSERISLHTLQVFDVSSEVKMKRQIIGTIYGLFFNANRPHDYGASFGSSAIALQALNSC